MDVRNVRWWSRRGASLLAVTLLAASLTSSAAGPAASPISTSEAPADTIRISADGLVTRSHGVAVGVGTDDRSVSAAPEMRSSAVTTTARGAASGPFAGFAARPTGGGYWIASANGGVSAYAGAQFHGDMAGQRLNAPVVGIASSASGNGYWLVAADGGIFTFGDAGFFGSTGNQRLNQPVIGMSSTTNGAGYWLFASDGGIFTFGNAGFHGSTGGIRLRKPVVGMTPRADGNGYWLVAADGGVFSFNVPFYGSTGNMNLNAPVVGALRSPAGGGYWLVAADGGVFTFGDAPYYGSTGGYSYMPSIVGLSPRSGNQAGYVVVGANGATWEFGPGVVASPPSSGACSVAIPPRPAASNAYVIGDRLSDGTPTRWSACAPIHWVLSTPEAPAGALTVLQQAFARASQETGLTFVYDGPTTARATEWIDQSWASGSAWKPVVIDFQAPGGPHLCGSAGCGWSAMWKGQIVAAAVILNKNMAAGWAPGAMMGPVALHELGHILGLDHVADPSQVMNATIMQAFTDYQLGDRNGLWQLGSGTVTLAKVAGP